MGLIHLQPGDQRIAPAKLTGRPAEETVKHAGTAPRAI